MLPTTPKQVILIGCFAILALAIICFFTQSTSVLSSYKSFRLDLKNLVGHCDEDSYLKGPPEQDDPRVLAAIRRLFLTPPSTLPYNLSDPNLKANDRRARTSFHFYHYYFKLFFGDQKTGFFLDSGALEGEHYSNSLWPEKAKGWNGLLVEVDVTNFRALTLKRRKAWISNTCIARSSYPQQVPFEFLDIPTSSSSYWVYKSNSRAADSPFTKVGGHMTRVSNITQVTMQCFPIASYLLALNVTTLDYLSLDIQGFEWGVLKALPLNKVTVRLMAVEWFVVDQAGRPSSAKDEAFIVDIERMGYQLVDRFGGNHVFAWKKDPALKKILQGKNFVTFLDSFNKTKAAGP